MLKLYISNRIEKLSLQFSKNIQTNNDIFSSEQIIMQTSGMERWLSLQTAEHNGVFANFQFIKPNSFINQLYETAGIVADSLYNTENLKWILYRFLDDDNFKKEFGQVAQYYAADDIKRLQLSVKLADLFDQYLLYRQEYIERWNQNKLAKVTRQQDETDQQFKNKQERLDKHQKWQFYLWRKIKEELPEESYDKVQLRDILIERLNNKDFQTEIQNRYSKISLFGLSVITDYHIEIFHRLSEFIDVNLYFLNPAPETYWYDIVSKKFEYYIEKKTGLSIETLKLHVGNELLSNYSALAKDTYNILFKSDDFVNALDDSLTETPKKNTLLEKIHHDIFNNLNEERNKISLTDIKDKSVIISSSYTPMREVEALYNQILYFLDKDKNLQAQDIIVQLSDVDLYTPYIRAVFDNAPYYLPYNIADRSYSGGDTMIGILEMLLKLSQEDFTSEKILQLLNSEFIKNKFGITNIDLIREIVRQANIRFGIKGYTEDDTCYVSWIYGLERVLLGYAIKGGDEFQLENYSTFPLDSIEGSDAQELLRFKAFVDLLINTVNKRTFDRPLVDWKLYIEDLIEDLIAIDKNADAEIKYIQKQLVSIENMNQWFDQAVSYEVFQKSLIDALFSNPRAGNFITGGITFCSMIPMRSIPYKVTAMLGLNGDKFPRTDLKIAFNLIEVEYKRGDRNTKNNDKYLFLETILSARKHLYLSYIGNSTKDNSIFNPSLLIEELKSYIDTGCSEIPKGKTLDDYILQKHPLHAFSKRYFDKSSSLFTYLEDNNTKKITRTKNKTQDIVPKEIKEISIQDLIRFFENPFKYYYNKTLQVYYSEDESLLPETEIFRLDSLQNWAIKSDILFSPDLGGSYLEKAKKTGSLPLANMGAVTLNTAKTEIKDLKETYETLSNNKQIESLNIDLMVADTRLRGVIFPIIEQQYIATNVSKKSSQAKYISRAWINHLCIIASKNKIDSLYLSSDYNPPKEWLHDLISLEDAQVILKKLIHIFIKGQREIIAYNPKIAYDLAVKLRRDKGIETKEKAALFAAHTGLKKLDTPNNQTGMYDPYIQKESEMGFFDNQEKIQSDLQEISSLIFDDLIRLEKI